MANKQFGSILRSLRNAKGYTQQEVADFLHLKNKSTLGSWEIGKSEPDAYTFLKLLTLYEIDDIYTTFDTQPLLPQQNSTTNDTSNFLAKFNQLNSKYQESILLQIDHLLELQKKL